MTTKTTRGAAIRAGMQRAKDTGAKSKKKSGAQRRREAREREAQQAARNGDLTPEAFDRLGAELDADRTPTPAPTMPRMPSPAEIQRAREAADAARDAKKNAKRPKKAAEPKTPKQYTDALTSLSRMNQRDLTWRANDMVKREKFATFALAMASILVNMRADVIDKYDGGFTINDTPAPIVDAPSVKAFVASLDAETVAAVKRTTKPSKKTGDAMSLAIAFASTTVDTIGVTGARKQLAKLVACAREKHPDKLSYYEAAAAEVERIAAVPKAEPKPAGKKRTKKVAAAA